MLTAIGRPGLLSWLLSLPRRATPLSLGGLIMGLVNLFGANLAAAALVSARRTNLGVGGWGDATRNLWGWRSAFSRTDPQASPPDWVDSRP